MKVSLVTVCRNNEGVIARAMASVLAQRTDGFELEYLVVDGASTDGTVDVIRGYAERFRGRMRWVSEPDGGIYEAMNKGIAMATGDIVGIVNSDDELEDDRVLGRIVSAFENEKELEAVYADIRFVRGERTVRYVSGRYFRPWMFRFATFPPHPSTFIRRDCFSRWGDYDTTYRISGDFDLLLRFMLIHGMKCRYLPLCTHRMSTGGASTTLSRHSEMELEDVRSIRSHGLFTCRVLTWLRYPLKLMELCRFFWYNIPKKPRKD